MDKLRFWMAPVALCVAWMAVAAYMLFRLVVAANQPVATWYAPEMEIEVPAQSAALAER